MNKEVRKAVEDELIFDPLVDATDITVRVRPSGILVSPQVRWWRSSRPRLTLASLECPRAAGRLRV